MEVAMPMSGTAIDCYEDMFKEITRKLYGEDGLPELSGGPTTSTTTGQQQQQQHQQPQERTPVGLTAHPMDYDVTDNPILKSEEHLTAFGLAALMQNGFPTTGILNSPFQPPQNHHHKVSATVNSNPTTNTIGSDDKWTASEDCLQWTQSKIATYNPSQKLFRCTECDCVGYLPRVAEHWLGTHSNVRAFQCPQCPYESAWARCVRMHLNRQHNISTDESSDTLTKNNPILQEITKYLQKLKNKIDGCKILDDYPPTINNDSPSSAGASNTNSTGSSKRYSCTYCPYSTDRRDLFTRHENIHREEKPFQCYVCHKQFNRADHVKKHFLRMHREHPYDLNRIRRHPPKNASGMSYYQKYNNSTNSSSEPAIPSLANLNPLSIPNGFANISRNSINNSATTIRPPIINDVKPSTIINKPLVVSKTNVSSSNGNVKKKGDKRFSCCYCSWSGVDNWCLKRHMNTHLKPFVCGLCDYKAARSERLATHVLKVHNKRACGKCSFLADDTSQLTIHQQEHHPLEPRSRSSNILRNTSSACNTAVSSASATSCSQAQATLKAHELSAAAALLQQHNNHRLLQQPDLKAWKTNNHHHHHQQQQQQQQQHNKQHGAARLFNYMEASDGSDPETESSSRNGDEMDSRMNLNHRIQSDFLEAGDVGSQDDDEEGAAAAGDGEMELPLFVCRSCGCEFEDDSSLETHQYAHRHSSTASPAINKLTCSNNSKENVNPNNIGGTAKKYQCRLCDFLFDSQSAVMSHMASHSSLTNSSHFARSIAAAKRPRKQSRPKKMVLPFDWDEVEGLRDAATMATNSRVSQRYLTRMASRRLYSCVRCKGGVSSKYHTRASLALHHFWKHSSKRYKCEHCDQEFPHKYQCVLHASRDHTSSKPTSLMMIKSLSNVTVPTTTKEPNNHNNAVPASSSSVTSDLLHHHHHHNFFALNTTQSSVPDASAHKLGMGMSFFDNNSFIHSNNTTLNGSHMPIIIPTFPPN